MDMLLNLDIDLDILIVDDSSPDNTARIAKDYNRNNVFIEKS